MILNQIVALASNLVIGKDNSLIWHYAEDLKFFKEMTSGHILIMGRKTYDSILKPRGKPLPLRFHIVISRGDHISEFENVYFVKNLQAAYEMAKMLIAKKSYPENVFVIGGAEIYHQSLQDCQKLWITKINQNFDGDVFYSPAYENYFKLESARTSLEHPELEYQVWKKKLDL